ncbi:MAG: type IV toxin-antitoxin system AbiEi family antitoxin domain-containing protein [Candidatus Eisenbacteria bacterium]|uniref:Type IV toxin-antitoxin system AbiEi family antitoxin domain-containing protein n=1 Tax=Eiseniibacteriota bacterium TaxID=2212470 RepID=A0A956NIW7_UNCEI|nr:type IV toxin-antitoxin system AbiEi family antitoxin domain-containing protein [Candidatus Eisenbacteria bacterium]
MAQSNETAALEVFSRLGVVRPSDLEAHGIARSVLASLQEKGLVVREARGIYTAAEHPITENHTHAVVSKSAPMGIVCLLSALRFHELTTQSPSEVWIAIPIKARRPRLEYPQLRVARFSGDALTEGVELHRVEGVEVKVYSAAKTVADSFKYRNKIGVDVAVEALRDFGRLYRGRATELAHFAKVCRVSRVMQPYLDAIA